MTIEINQPELEEMIQHRLRSGAFQSIEELLLQALRATASEDPPPVRPGSNAQSLAELFASSPFAGMNIDFEREKDTGREIEL